MYIYIYYRNFDETNPNFTLELIMKIQMQIYEDQISEISNKATIELNMENVTIITLLSIQKNYNVYVFIYLVN